MSPRMEAEAKIQQRSRDLRHALAAVNSCQEAALSTLEAFRWNIPNKGIMVARYNAIEWKIMETLKVTRQAINELGVEEK